MTRLAAIISFLILSITTAFGSEHDEIGQYQFIEWLYQNKDYYRAISESLRFIFLYPDSLRIIDAKILMADAYERGGDEESALKQYLGVIAQYPESDRLPDVFMRLGKLYSKNGDYQTSTCYFKKALTDGALKRKAKEWILLNELLNDADDNSIRQRIQEFNLQNDNQVLNLYDNYKSLAFKSPRTAGILASIVPGAGHWYIGRRWDAAAAFILNGLFIWGAVESFHNDQTGVAVALAVLESGWYGGNIYGAINGAHKYNRKLKQDFYERFTWSMNLNAREQNYGEPAYCLSFRWAY